MKFLKNNIKVVIAFILGLILAGGIVYAATTARDVSYTTAKNENIKNVEEALNDLYSKKQDEGEWVEIENAFVTEHSYQLSSPKLYKKGNLCKITFCIDSVTKDVAYSLINDSRYYPKEQVEIYAWGTANGMASVTLKTDGSFVITGQTQGWQTGWSAVKNVVYEIND